MKVRGMSWIQRGAHGTWRRDIHGSHDDLRHLHRLLTERRILCAPLEGFGRFDYDSRAVCLAAALALHDAGITRASSSYRGIGLIMSGTAGSRDSNLAYFRDYAEQGRVLGRANLFIYTLPTSPAAEAAIHLGLKGPLCYIGPVEAWSGEEWLEQAEILMEDQAEIMLCVLMDEKAVICVVAEGRPSDPEDMDMRGACALIRKIRTGTGNRKEEWTS